MTKVHNCNLCQYWQDQPKLICKKGHKPRFITAKLPGLHDNPGYSRTGYSRTGYSRNCDDYLDVRHPGQAAFSIDQPVPFRPDPDHNIDTPEGKVFFDREKTKAIQYPMTPEQCLKGFKAKIIWRDPQGKGPDADDPIVIIPDEKGPYTVIIKVRI